MLMKTGMGKIHVRIYFNIIKYIIREEGGIYESEIFYHGFNQRCFRVFPLWIGATFPLSEVWCFTSQGVMNHRIGYYR